MRYFEQLRIAWIIEMVEIYGFINRSHVCKKFGITHQGEIDGSMIGKMFAEGRNDEIATYCRQDIERVRKVHYKMKAAFGN